MQERPHNLNSLYEYKRNLPTKTGGVMSNLV